MPKNVIIKSVCRSKIVFFCVNSGIMTRLPSWLIPTMLLFHKEPVMPNFSSEFSFMRAWVLCYIVVILFMVWSILGANIPTLWEMICDQGCPPCMDLAWVRKLEFSGICRGRAYEWMLGSWPSRKHTRQLSETGMYLENSWLAKTPQMAANGEYRSCVSRSSDC